MKRLPSPHSLSLIVLAFYSSFTTGECTKKVKVKTGDICFQLAKDNGITVDQIKEINKGVSCEDLKVGSDLCVADSTLGGVGGAGNGGGGGGKGGGGGGGGGGAGFCSGKTATGGKQNKASSCSATIQGNIPSFDNMVSTLIISPKNGAKVDTTKTLAVTIDVLHMETGFFSDAKTQYYFSPQSLNGQGIIQGHQHITIQEIGNANTAMDPRKFVFFQGINDKSTDGRSLSVTVPANTLKNGVQYRICSLTGANTHQPVIMPVAQRGSQDDCIRVEGGGAGGGGGTGTAAAQKKKARKKLVKRTIKISRRH